MFKKLISFVLLLCLAIVKIAGAQQAQLIWSHEESYGSRIQISDYENGQWQAPETIVFDFRANILPTLTATTKGRIAVWTVVAGSQTHLYYSQSDGNTWQRPTLFETGFKTNLAPVLVHDATYTPWLFWSANNGDDDDIYYSIFKQNAWQMPKLAHADNQVPDILPQATLMSDGQVKVSWQQLENGAYQDKFQVFAIDKVIAGLNKTHSISQLKSLKAATAPPALPAFFKSKSRASVYMPKQMPKSQTIDGNIQ